MWGEKKLACVDKNDLKRVINMLQKKDKKIVNLLTCWFPIKNYIHLRAFLVIEFPLHSGT